MSAMVLACDVKTANWGTFAHGLPVDVAESTDSEVVVILADLPRNRLFARVPRHVVRRAGWVPPRVPRRVGVVAASGVEAAAWSDVKEDS